VATILVGSHRLVVISGHDCALDHSLVSVDRDVLYNDLLLSATLVVDQAAHEIGTSDQSQNGQSDGRRCAASFLVRADKLIEQYRGCRRLADFVEEVGE
jgi:hypothetical protein